MPREATQTPSKMVTHPDVCKNHVGIIHDNKVKSSIKAIAMRPAGESGLTFRILRVNFELFGTTLRILQMCLRIAIPDVRGHVRTASVEASVSFICWAVCYSWAD